MKISLFVSSIIALLLAQLSLHANSAPNIIANNIADYSRVWTDQYGSYEKDYVRSMTIDSSGNLYITGNTQGYLEGNSNSGSDDIFLTKYGSDGVRLWTKQYGSSTVDYGHSVTTDSSGNIYITGSTWGDLDGNTNSGFTDLFLTKFSSDGTKLWTKQYGTDTYDVGSSVTIDSSGNIYITGETYGDLDGNSNSGGADIFLAKYGSDGSKIWTEQYGSSANETGRSVTIDSSDNIYITGYTGGGLDGNTNSGSDDIFLTKYGSDGTKQWTKQYGSSSGDTGNSVITDSSENIYITGTTGGGLDGNTNSGSSDIFLTKFGSDGDRLWTKQYGSSSREFGNSVTTDSSGNLYITGFTDGGLDGNSNSGLSDIFLTKFNSGGTKLWTKQYGTSDKDSGNSVITDSSGNIYITGATAGCYLDGNSCWGDDDVFLTKFTRTIELDHAEGSEQVIDIYATDTDGDTLIYSISGGVDSNEFTIESASGVVSFAVPPFAYYPTDDNADNIYEVAITVSDGNGGSDTVTLFIKVSYISNGSSTSPEYTRSWTDQYGSSTQEQGHSVATDSSGNIYITGYTYGGIDGNPDSINNDVFLSKYSSDGTRLWTKQDAGDHGYMTGKSVTTDSSDNIYVTGVSWGDVFLSKYNSNGTKLWTIVAGEDWTQDSGNSVTTDSSGNVYITGKAENYIVLAKVSSSGSILWYKRYRSSVEDAGNSVTTDSSGNIYIAGTAYGDLDGNTNSGECDIFLTKFSSDGTKLWTKQYGSSREDFGESVITDSRGYIYITGYTGGDLDGNTKIGGYDIFLTKFSSGGTKLWTKQYGTGSYDYGKSLTIDSGDNLYITGETSGSLDGNTKSGYSDVFLTKFSSDGTKLWTEQYGSSRNDAVESVTFDSRGNIYIGGYTFGDLDGNTNSGIMDIFLTKFSRTTTLNNTDFTTNGHNDLLWHQESIGAIKIMQMNGMTPEEDISVVSSSNLNLLPKGIGDFTRDGKPDILFHNQNSGNLRIWEMDGTSRINNIQVLGSSNTNLKIAGVGDFDLDGDNDIATFNTNSGALRMWVMEGTTRVDNVLVLTGANTNLVPRGAGDMDNDGIPDIVLRNNNSGAVRVWTMNSNFTRKGNEYVTGSSNTNLELRGVMDINGDGNNDILNYNTNTGKLRAWLMDGNLKITENAEIVQNLDLDWSVRN